MIERKKKKCKGTTDKTKGLGCGELKDRYKYGLCKSCFVDWWFNTEDGGNHLRKEKLKLKQEEEKKEKADLRLRKQEVKTSSKNFNLYATNAWKWCSHYVLLYYADSNNVVQCSTSPNLAYHITDSRIHVGHYIKWRDGNSTNNSTALLFENLAPQNAGDNTKLGGKPEVMEKWLIEKHGLEKIENLKVLRRQSYKLDPYTLMEISEKYRLLFNALLKERGLNNPWQT